MALKDRLKALRAETGFSQEMVAEQLGVSRQAVTKWETGQTLPNRENLSALAELYGVSLNDLIEERAGWVREGEDNPIIREGNTVLALSGQVGALYACTWALYNGLRSDQNIVDHLLPIVGNVVLLILCSMWTVWNLSFEQDLSKRRNNIRIELRYMLVQLVLAGLSFYFKLGLLGLLLAAGVLVLYLKVINPKYMGRELWQKSHRKRQKK